MDSDRRIYRYNDGKGDVYADPLVIHRRFTQAMGGDAGPAFEAARAPEKDDQGKSLSEPPERVLARLAAEEALAAAAREAFELPAYDRSAGEGPTEAECLTVLYSWLRWLEGNAEKVAS